MQIVKLKDIKPNPNNPRIIKDEKFQKLVASIKEFPQMLEIRPVVVNKDMIVLGGNMRLKALKEAGLTEVPCIIADELSEDQQRQFIIKDNIGYGEWDWEMLANEWDTEQLADWGMNVPDFDPNVDYSILDDDDINSQLDDMAGGVRKAIQIEFEPDHYDEAFELVKFWREREAYVGMMLLEHLKEEKERL